MTLRYFEAIPLAGQKFALPTSSSMPMRSPGSRPQFDPQPFHLDDAAGMHTVFEGLAASGWHTASLTMRLCVASDFPAGRRYLRHRRRVETG